MITEFLVSTGEKKKRLDQFLVHREPEISRSRLQRLIELGRIRVNEALAKPGQKIKPGDRITMDTPQPGILQGESGIRELDILYEDEDLLVVNKPSGVVVHPTSGNWSGTLFNALLAHFKKHERNIKPGIVHRLDKETSGVMVVAKKSKAHRALAAQFEVHRVTRVYEAFVAGVPRLSRGVVQLPIGRDEQRPKIVSSNATRSKDAVTEYRVLEKFHDVASHVELRPRSGRTHQLRVHMAYLGCPILGDRMYGISQEPEQTRDASSRLMLHARTLGFIHPISWEYREYSVAMPDEMNLALKELHNWRAS